MRIFVILSWYCRGARDEGTGIITSSQMGAISEADFGQVSFSLIQKMLIIPWQIVGNSVDCSIERIRIRTVSFRSY